MKLVSTALLAAGLVALSACGDGGEENVAANNAAEDLYNIAPEDLGDENLLGNETLGNDTDLGNLSTDGAGDNAAAENATNSQ